MGNQSDCTETSERKCSSGTSSRSSRNSQNEEFWKKLRMVARARQGPGGDSDVMSTMSNGETSTSHNSASPMDLAGPTMAESTY